MSDASKIKYDRAIYFVSSLKEIELSEILIREETLLAFNLVLRDVFDVSFNQALRIIVDAKQRFEEKRLEESIAAEVT